MIGFGVAAFAAVFIAFVSHEIGFCRGVRACTPRSKPSMLIDLTKNRDTTRVWVPSTWKPNADCEKRQRIEVVQ